MPPNPLKPDKGPFPHYLLKEIFDQPAAVRDTVFPRLSRQSGQVRLPEVGLADQELRALRRINIAASGSSRHAGLAAKFMITGLAGLPVDVDYASEFEYRNPITGPGELAILITQSGETADTSGALREAKAKGSRTLAITNVSGSTIAREADGFIYTQAGPEISIAATKSFTSQLAALFLFSLYLGQVRETISPGQERRYLDALLALPSQLETVLGTAPQCERLSVEYAAVQDFLYMGRGVHYPIALDGALKLKEVSYVHAEGYPTGEAKHGPSALIDENLPVVVIATRDPQDEDSEIRYKLTLGNLRAMKQQSARIIAVASEADDVISGIADHTIFVPHAPELLAPLLEIVPLQLFAYYMAVRRGRNIDSPRNLVKSVMLE